VAGMSHSMQHYRERLMMPYLSGVYLGINGLSDSYLIVDGPMCAFYKVEQLQGNHDTVAELTRLALPPRITHSNLHVDGAMMGEEGHLETVLRQVNAIGDAGAIFVVGSSCSQLIGRDTARVLGSLGDDAGAPLLEIPSNVLSGDWLDGYAATLSVLARSAPLARRRPARRPRVGIVGRLFSRHEGDVKGDLVELERMTTALGAELVSVWLSGQRFADLAEIGRADVIVSLPYAREAAAVVASRAGATLVEAPLPLSFAETEKFLSRLGEALGRERPARDFAEAEKAALAAPLLFLIEQYLLDTRWALVVDRHAAPGWLALAEEAGAQPVILCCPHREGPIDHPAILAEDRSFPVVFGANPGWLAALADARKANPYDFLIGNGQVAQFAPPSSAQFFEFGYPSYSYHPILPAPTLGFRGEAHLVERLAELAARRKLMEHA